MLRQARVWMWGAAATMAAVMVPTGQLMAQPPAEPVAPTERISGRPSVPGGLILERVLVRINGDIITQTNLEDRQVDALRQRGLQPTTDAELRQAIIDVTPQVISTAVDEILIVQQGRQLGYHLSDEQFEEIVEGIKSENNIANDAELEEALMQSDGMTMDDLREVMERQMLINQVQQIEILRKVTLTDSEAREHYDNNVQDYTEPATVTMREILIRVPQGIGGSVNVAADDQARADAEEARARILAGEDFSLVAVAVSDAASKANGGLIGPIDLAFVNDALQTALNGLEADQVSEPIRTAVGYHLLQLVERTEPTPLPFEEVRDTIGNSVFSERRVTEYLSYLDRLRSEAVIEWNDEQLEQAYVAFEPLRSQAITTGGQ